MSTPSTVDDHQMDEHEEMDAEEHLDSSSSQVHDSSKEGETEDQTNAKPKRNRKSTQRFLDSIVDDEQHLHKQKKKLRPTRKMDSDTGPSHNDEMHSDAASDHDMGGDDSEKGHRARIVPGKAHVQCTFMESKKKLNSQCKQRAIDTYLFCIWHILNDKEAPYKRCAHLRTKIKNGTETQVQCKTAIKRAQNPPFCLAHSDKVKKPKKKRDSGPSTSSTSKGGSSAPSPRVRNSMAPSSPSASSSLFNLPNEEFAQDIDEAIGNMETGSFVDNFDDFESILDEDEENEDTVDAPKGIPFETDDDYDSHERELIDAVVVPIYGVGKKIIDRLKRMREKYATGVEFWQACHVNPDAPSTADEYVDKFMSEGRFECLKLSDDLKEEIRGLLSDPASDLSMELALTHKYNMDLLKEQQTLQRSKLNNDPAL